MGIAARDATPVPVAFDCLRESPFTEHQSLITDLTPLADSPIRELYLEGCIDLTDLRPLLGMKQLEAVIIPVQCKDIEFLRTHPSLRRLSYKKLTQPVYEFWQEFDAKKNAPAGRLPPVR